MAEPETLVFVARNPIDGNLFIKECAEKFFSIIRLPVPSSLTLLRADNGKPYFEDNPVFVSFTHSGEISAAAVSLKPVGVDAEQKKDSCKFPELSERFCGEKLDGYSFFRRWLFAEAAFKALGGAVTEFLKLPIKNMTYFDFENYLIGVYSENGRVSLHFSH